MPEGAGFSSLAFLTACRKNVQRATLWTTLPHHSQKYGREQTKLYRTYKTRARRWELYLRETTEEIRQRTLPGALRPRLHVHHIVSLLQTMSSQCNPQLAPALYKKQQPRCGVPAGDTDRTTQERSARVLHSCGFSNSSWSEDGPSAENPTPRNSLARGVKRPRCDAGATQPATLASMPKLTASDPDTRGRCTYPGLRPALPP